MRTRQRFIIYMYIYIDQLLQCICVCMLVLINVDWIFGYLQHAQFSVSRLESLFVFCKQFKLNLSIEYKYISRYYFHAKRERKHFPMLYKRGYFEAVERTDSKVLFKSLSKVKLFLSKST